MKIASLSIYMLLFILAITVTLYNLFFAKQVIKSGKEIGIPVPFVFSRILIANAVFSLITTGTVAFIFLLTFFSP